jgi:CBS domain-containing protein
MAHRKVRDVMTVEVVTARDDALPAEISAILADRHISGVPIVDRFDAVVGLVSWTDLREKIEPGASAKTWSPDHTAVEIMSAPLLTIGSEATLASAGRMMHRRNVDRLLVVDDDGGLRGIVTRSDLLKVHGRLDAVIRDEVMQQVLRRTLMLEAGTVDATVDDGVVTLVGRTARRTTALAAVGLAEAVAGVTEVVDRLAFDIDDTLPPDGNSEPADRDPIRGWWTGQGDQSDTSARETAGDGHPGRDDQRPTDRR